MINPLTNQDFTKSRGLIFLEYVVLALCLCVIALRATFTESPTVQPATQPINLTAGIYSLLISTILILSLFCYLLWALCSKKFYFRFTGLEIGLGLFILSAFVAGSAASDKRAAITSFVLFIAPPLAAVLLVQILDSRSKIILLLVCIAALGVVNTWQSGEQLFISNQVTIEQYEHAPQNFLEPLDMEPGSFAHWLFEHRLYSKGVRGFFTTSNSAGSFALLASFAAVAVFLDRFKNRKSDNSAVLSLFTTGFVVAVVVFGLVITKSKGAIAASLLTAAMFIAYLLFGNWLKAHRKAILALCLLLLVIAACTVVFYGLTHGRLPGGNSMLVRWQYWKAAAKMYADHSITGVGPGNFTYLYTHYKPPSALEAVADPHNFLLSILAQYGPLGLVGFLAMVFVPLLKIIFSDAASSFPKSNHAPSSFNLKAFVFLTVVSIALLSIRPIILPMPAADSLAVTLYILFILYVLPVIIFIAAFLLLTIHQTKTKTSDTRPEPQKNMPGMQYAIRNTSIIAALFCACLGVLFHNLIDFAIFEPGVLTAFWMIMACLVAIDSHRKPIRPLLLKSAAIKAPLVVLLLLVIGAYFKYSLISPVKAAVRIIGAHKADVNGWFHGASELLNAAGEVDIISPAAPASNGRLHLRQFYISGTGEVDLLLNSEKYLLEAINRNKADYKNFERLTEVYIHLAESSSEPERTRWLKRAFDAACDAVGRYPGCARLHFKLAEIAEQLKKTGVALERFEKTVQIEDAFRTQFGIMYPDRQMFSRLGEGRYQTAKQKIKQLSQKPAP